jgi:hypothetical protein
MSEWNVLHVLDKTGLVSNRRNFHSFGNLSPDVVLLILVIADQYLVLGVTRNCSNRSFQEPLYALTSHLNPTFSSS